MVESVRVVAVQIDRNFDLAPSPSAPQTAQGEQLVLKIKNKSTPTITGVKVAVLWVDAAGEIHQVSRNLTSDAKLKPGKSVEFSWSKFDYRKDATGWVAVVQKVLFEDESTWERPDDSTSCFGQWRKRGQKPVTSLPPIRK